MNITSEVLERRVSFRKFVTLVAEINKDISNAMRGIFEMSEPNELHDNYFGISFFRELVLDGVYIDLELVMVIPDEEWDQRMFFVEVNWFTKHPRYKVSETGPDYHNVFNHSALTVEEFDECFQEYRLLDSTGDYRVQLTYA